ncbi:hypothetical protein AGMMS49587_10540 [Spirochaetia bacterium]|nr:hypothetical protein AGMMS49587_10540 [Spirochaetia bacterium]
MANLTQADIDRHKKEEEKRKFILNTKKHGDIQFDTFIVWRIELVLEREKDIESIPSKLFCLNVAKYFLLDFCGLKINKDYYKKIKNISEIKLILNYKETQNFAELLIKNNIDDIEPGDIEDKHDIKNDFDIIKQYFINERDRYDNLIKSMTGFLNVNLTPKVFSNLDTISKLANINSVSMRSGLDAISRTKFDYVPMHAGFDAISRIHDLKPLPIPKIEPVKIPEIHDNKLGALMDIKETIYSFIEKYEKNVELNNEIIKLSNGILQDVNQNIKSQIDSAEKNSKEAKWHSNIALAISLIALLASLIFGVIQTNLTHKSNVQIETLNTSIQTLNHSIITNNDFFQNIGENLNHTNEFLKSLPEEIKRDLQAGNVSVPGTSN